ncbi:trypsin-like peptidase domain-containing protein [Rhodocaloribacter sp.]
MRNEGWRKIIVPGVASLLWLGAWAPVAPRVSPGGAGVQIFSVVERTAVAVGAPLVMRVEVYAASGSKARLEEAFRHGAFVGGLDGLELLSREDVPARRRTDADGASVLVVTGRFVLRALRAGVLTTPVFEVRYDGRTYAARAHRILAYRVAPRIFTARRAVVPVDVEVHDPDQGRIYLRNGSAFLVAPDAFITSYHVAMDADRIRLTLPGGKRLSIRKVWAVDPVRDVVVLYVDPKETRKAGMEPLPLSAVMDGARRGGGRVAFTYGWPGGVQRSTAGERYPEIVLNDFERLWVSANPVRPGDSGGPLLNEKGEVLGVVSAGTVLGRRHEILREEVSIATDPRPALRRRFRVRRPRSLKEVFDDPAFQALPHVQAFRLSAMLAVGPRNRSRFDQWLADFDEALARWDEPDPGLHFMRGVIYQMLGTPEDAAAAYRAALDVYDGFFPAAYMLAQQHLEAQEYAAAERLFARTQAYAPYTHLALYGRAQALMGLLRYEQAAALLEAVLNYDAAFAPAVYDLAVCRLALGDEARVQALLAHLTDTSPRWARRLRMVLRTPALHPVTLLPRPRASLAVHRPPP